MANFFHDSARVSPLSSIDISSRGTHTRIGANSVIDDYVKIKHVGGDGHVEIGENVYLNSFTVIYSGNGVKIGNDVLIGPNCSIVPSNHNFADRNIPMRLQKFGASRGGVVIEDDVWIGAGTIILDGAYIAKGSVIGAGSLVNKRTEPYSINVGNPLTCKGFR